MGTSSQRVSVREVAGVFLKLGCIGFGGPAAHMALMEQEIVRRRQWVSREEFLDMLGAAHLIPGPNSTELALHLGHRMAGWAGLAVAGLSFMLPATLIVTALAWAYVALGASFKLEWLLFGVKPVVIAIVLQAMWGLGRSALKSGGLAVVAGAAFGLAIAGVNEILLLAAAGAVWAVATRLKRGSAAAGAGLGALLALPGSALPGLAAAVATSVPFGLWPLFWTFLKIGSVMFGSGYVLIAFLDADLVSRFGWLTRPQLLDAIAMGHVIPGPVSTTATFIGFLLGGPVAAAVATLGMFLPAFLFVAVSGPLIPRLRASRTAGAALDGVIAASLALMAAATLQLARAAIVDLATAFIAAAAAIALLRFRLGPAWLLGAGAAAGILIRLTS